MNIDAFPLAWPLGWPRTERQRRSAFKVSFAQARDGVMRELRMMGATEIVISTNRELRRDGLPYAGRPEPVDTGVAVYFTTNDKDKTIPCDRWDRIQDNMQAIRKTIEALRGLERWGAKQMVDAAFQGFEALSAQSQHGWWVVLDVLRDSSHYTVKTAYLAMVREAHPDAGGNPENFHQIQSAYDEFKRERGL